MSATLGRVLLFRHLAICASALMAYLLRQELQVGYAVLAVVTGSAVLNFALYLLRVSPRAEPLARIASPVIGLGAWTALIAVTNGVASPFVAGLWLEALLAAMVFPPGAVLMVGGASLLALIGQQLWLGLRGHEWLLTLELGILCSVGGLTYGFALRAARRERALEQEQLRLGEELGRLEDELEDERVLGRVGEHAGRLAHRLKNQVHSLRGFLSLLEPAVGERGQPALAGLRDAIDDLEALARQTLQEDEAIGGSQVTTGSRGIAGVVDRALAEVRGTHPGVEWKVALGEALPEVGLTADRLDEVLVILLRNAIEAMKGHGKGELEVFATGAGLCLRVGDEGEGLSEEDVERIFRAGYTTKREGSGYGLFLARRIVGEHAGHIEARPRAGGGAVFEVHLPALRSAAPAEE